MRPEDLRAQVPLLQRCTYLDSAATSLKPASVLDAMRRFYEDVGASVERGAHGPGSAATEGFEAARRSVGAVLGMDPQGLVLARNCTHALGLLAHGLEHGPLRDLGPGDTLVTSVFEHHSMLLPWQRLAQRTGAALHVARPAGPRLDASLLDDAPGRVRLVAVQHASNVTGAVHDVAGIARRARELNALCAVDGAQRAGHAPLDVRALGCDAYAASGHKGLLGPMGTGLLWARPDLLAAMEPAEPGGGTIRDVQEQTSTLRIGPRAFEGGTPDVAGVLGLAEGARIVAAIGPGRIATHERALTQRLRAGLRDAGATLLGPEEGVGVVSFNLPGWDAHDVALALDLDGIAVRSGNHCALPLARWLGTLDPHGGSVRASFHYYNTAADVDRLLAAVGKLA